MDSGIHYGTYCAVLNLIQKTFRFNFLKWVQLYRPALVSPIIPFLSNECARKLEKNNILQPGKEKAGREIR
jgi:hypothetical protein